MGLKLSCAGFLRKKSMLGIVDILPAIVKERVANTLFENFRNYEGKGNWPIIFNVVFVALLVYGNNVG